jgi:hypothetical protein
MIILFVLVIIGIVCLQKYAPPAVSGSIMVIVIIVFCVLVDKPKKGTESLGFGIHRAWEARELSM